MMIDWRLRVLGIFILVYLCKEGDTFLVYSTTQCPQNSFEVKDRSSVLNCTDSKGYMCLPNKNLTELSEFCYTSSVGMKKGTCLVLENKTTIDTSDCPSFADECPDKHYFSQDLFKYPGCAVVRTGCLLENPPCKRNEFEQESAESSNLNKDDMDEEIVTFIAVNISSIIAIVIVIITWKQVRRKQRGAENGKLLQKPNEPQKPNEDNDSFDITEA